MSDPVGQELRRRLADRSGDQRLAVCLQQCEEDEQCRSGYACSGVSNGSGEVCRKQGS